MSRGKYRLIWYRFTRERGWTSDVWETTSYHRAVERGQAEVAAGASHYEVLTLREPRL